MPELQILEHAAVIIASLIAIIAMALYITEHRSRTNLVKQHRDDDLSQTKIKSSQIIEEAIKHSQNILSQAQQESVELLRQTNQNSQNFTAEYQKQFENLEAEFNHHLNQRLSSLENQFTTYLSQLEEKSKNAEENMSQSISGSINQIIERFEQNLTDFFTKAQHESISSIEFELKSSRQLIDTYKQQQLRLIDENIIALLERTLSIVLAKKLSLKDQLDLVYEGLERAKVEKFLN